MCTLSLIRFTDERWRVKFNRDEQRERPAALPPIERRYGQIVAQHPIDPLSGGTWIAATSAGLVLALLNEYGAGGAADGGSLRSMLQPEEVEPRAPLSRGRIVPQLVDAMTIDEVVRRAHRLDVERYPPFRLVAIDACRVIQMVSDGRAIASRSSVRARRWMCTSSSVRPEVVRASRAAAFERLVTSPSVAAQDRFHDSRRAVRSEGVRMVRFDAQTVSMTTIDVCPQGVRMTYRPLESTTTSPFRS